MSQLHCTGQIRIQNATNWLKDSLANLLLCALLRDSERRLLGDQPDSADDLLRDQTLQEHAAALSGTHAQTGLEQMVTQSAESAAAVMASASEAVQPAQDPRPAPDSRQDANGQNRQQAGSSQSSSSSNSGRPRLVWRLLALIQRIDEESWTCYVFFVLIFVLDMSLLTMLFPVSLAAYALATQRPSAFYWQVSPCIGHQSP